MSSLERSLNSCRRWISARRRTPDEEAAWVRVRHGGPSDGPLLCGESAVGISEFLRRSRQQQALCRPGAAAMVVRLQRLGPVVDQGGALAGSQRPPASRTIRSPAATSQSCLATGDHGVNWPPPPAPCDRRWSGGSRCASAATAPAASICLRARMRQSLDLRLRAHMDGRSVQAGAAALGGVEHLVGQRGCRPRRRPGAPSSTTAAQMVKCGRPLMKATVPSMGSTMKMRRACQPRRIVLAFLRQPAIIGPRRGAGLAKKASTARSASVTGLPPCPCSSACIRRRRYWQRDGAASRTARPAGRYRPGLVQAPAMVIPSMRRWARRSRSGIRDRWRASSGGTCPSDCPRW